jgi:acetoin utilization deacetylase AcuC-like enzyme
MHKTGLVYHPDYLKHITGKEHPENPQRLKAIISGLEKSGLASRLQKIEAKHSTLEWMEKVHSKSYIQQIQMAGQKGAVLLDSDTMVGPESFNVAVLAVSGVLAGCDAVMSGKVRNTFCAIRPPGHHAEKERAMGFCLFNNVAVAARYLQEAHKLRKILIVDWDVHHGNGTQHIFYEDDSVYYFSIHQFPHYPGTGREEEEGEGKGHGYTLNVPMCAGSGDLEYLEVFDMIFYPEAVRFKPDFILISAGFDGHKDDPLSDLRMTEKGYQRMTEIVMDLAQVCCEGRVVSVLEGGYNLPSLSSSVKTHVQTLLTYEPGKKK